MFGLIPYLWMAFMLAVLVTPIVVGIMNKPKRMPKPKVEEIPLEGDGTPQESQILDFGDELAQMEQK